MHVCMYLFSVDGRIFFLESLQVSMRRGQKEKIVHQRHFSYACWEQKQNNTKLTHPTQVHTVYD